MSDIVFAGQTALRIQLTCGQYVIDASAIKIKYQKPDGTTGEWDAEVDVEVATAASGVIYHDVATDTELDVAGWWQFWAYVTFSDGRSAAGEKVRFKVYDA